MSVYSTAMHYGLASRSKGYYFVVVSGFIAKVMIRHLCNLSLNHSLHDNNNSRVIFMNPKSLGNTNMLT